MQPQQITNSVNLGTPLEPPKTYSTVANLRLRNFGKTAAVGVRITAVDFYLHEGIGKSATCSVESIKETLLPLSGHRSDTLPYGLAAVFTVCGSAVLAGNISGFRIGGAPAGASSSSAGKTTVSWGGGQALQPGLHLVRLVAHANGIAPTTHFVALEIGRQPNQVGLRLATRQEKAAIKRADLTRTALEIG